MPCFFPNVTMAPPVNVVTARPSRIESTGICTTYCALALEAHARIRAAAVAARTTLMFFFMLLASHRVRFVHCTDETTARGGNFHASDATGTNLVGVDWSGGDSRDIFRVSLRESSSCRSTMTAPDA